MTLIDLFTKYWSQVTLLLAMLGFFIKYSFDLKAKKYETNHMLFQQNRIKSIVKYIEAYAETELMWRRISIFTILAKKTSVDEMDKYIWPPLNKLKSATIENRLYFEDFHNEIFDEILNNFLEVNSHLSSLYFNIEKNDMINANANQFHSFKEEKLIKNEKYLKQICREVKMLYKAK